MQLYILRHAEAEAFSSIGGDQARKLTAKGKEQAKKVGEFCLRNKILPDMVLTSPYLRALETAEIFCSTANLPKPEKKEFIASGASPGMILSGLNKFNISESVMIAGHEPDFSSLIEHLLDMRGFASINVKKSSLIALSLSEFSKGSATLLFSIPVKFMS